MYFGLLLHALFASVSLGQGPKASNELGKREGNRWTIPWTQDGDMRIPRVYASLRSARFQLDASTSINVQPEVDFWILKSAGKHTGDFAVLEFDTPPLLQSEVKPVEPEGDGTFTLRCSQGETKGEKLRFEPQPFKNTIGYWTNASDYVVWSIQLEKATQWNVGIMQGCGPRGGGKARVSLLKQGAVLDFIEFSAEPTGHFQNFVWRHLGTLKANETGELQVRIEAIQIADIALMDVRQLHLSPTR
jgi:hypothetical protein